MAEKKREFDYFSLDKNGTSQISEQPIAIAQLTNLVVYDELLRIAGYAGIQMPAQGIDILMRFGIDLGNGKGYGLEHILSKPDHYQPIINYYKNNFKHDGNDKARSLICFIQAFFIKINAATTENDYREIIAAWSSETKGNSQDGKFIFAAKMPFKFERFEHALLVAYPNQDGSLHIATLYPLTIEKFLRLYQGSENFRPAKFNFIAPNDGIAYTLNQSFWQPTSSSKEIQTKKSQSTDQTPATTKIDNNPTATKKKKERSKAATQVKLEAEIFSAQCLSFTEIAKRGGLKNATFLRFLNTPSTVITQIKTFGDGLVKGEYQTTLDVLTEEIKNLNSQSHELDLLLRTNYPLLSAQLGFLRDDVTRNQFDDKKALIIFNSIVESSYADLKIYGDKLAQGVLTIKKKIDTTCQYLSSVNFRGKEMFAAFQDNFNIIYKIHEDSINLILKVISPNYNKSIYVSVMLANQFMQLAKENKLDGNCKDDYPGMHEIMQYLYRQWQSIKEICNDVKPGGGKIVEQFVSALDSYQGMKPSQKMSTIKK